MKTETILFEILNMIQDITCMINPESCAVYGRLTDVYNKARCLQAEINEALRS